jgi:sortase B
MGTRRLKPFCVVKASGDEMLRRTSFTDDGDFASFVQAALDRNDVETDITADQVSHLYMFSTCSYEFDDARTIVYAVEVDEQGDPIANT